MYKKAQKSMSLEEIVAFLDDLDGGSRKEKRTFLDQYRSAALKQDYGGGGVILEGS